MRFLRPDAAWLLALLAIPVILYLLPLPRLRRRMASTLLWQRVMNLQGISARRRLWRVLGAILLNALILVLIISAFGRLWFVSASRDAGVVVVVLDNSASMRATEDDVSRFELARGRALAFVESLPGGTRVVVMTTAPAPAFVARPTNVAAAAEALGRVQPFDAPGSPDAAIRLVRGALAGNSLTLHVFSDVVGETYEADPAVTWHAVGRSQPNAGIVAFGALRIEVPQPGVFVQARIANFSPSPREATLVLRAAGGTVESKTLTLPPETELAVDWTLPAVEAGIVRLEMTPGDAFDLDDRAAAVLEPSDRKRVVLVADKPPERLLAALRADRSIRTFIIEPAKYQPNLSSDLAVFIGAPPVATGDHNVLIINPGAPCILVDSVGAARGAGRVVADESHPLLADIAWRDGFIESAPACRAAPHAEVVAGDAQGPLILSGRLGERRAVVLAFDPETQPISRSRAFPILVRNCIAHLASAESSARARSWQPGETVRLAADEGVRDAVLVGPDGSEREIAADDGLFAFACDRVGLWRLRSDSGETTIPVNLGDAAESDLRASRNASAKPARATFLTPVMLWNAMIVAGALLLVIEAFLYHRRVLE